MANIIMNVLITTPENVIKLNEGGMFSVLPYEGDWNYDWCRKNWGTKWDMYKVKYVYDIDEDGTQAMAFITANGDIEPFLINSGIEYFGYSWVDIDNGEDPDDICIDKEVVNYLLGEN